MLTLIKESKVVILISDRTNVKAGEVITDKKKRALHSDKDVQFSKKI